MLYSKNGSIPKPETDGTPGWEEVPDPPFAAQGLEVVWWYPPGWVVRPVQPEPVEGAVWAWSQTQAQWISYPVLDSTGTDLEPEAVKPVQTLPLISGNVSL